MVGWPKRDPRTPHPESLLSPLYFPFHSVLGPKEMEQEGFVPFPPRLPWPGSAGREGLDPQYLLFYTRRALYALALPRTPFPLPGPVGSLPPQKGPNRDRSSLWIRRFQRPRSSEPPPPPRPRPFLPRAGPAESLGLGFLKKGGSRGLGVWERALSSHKSLLSEPVIATAQSVRILPSQHR